MTQRKILNYVPRKSDSFPGRYRPKKQTRVEKMAEKTPFLTVFGLFGHVDDVISTWNFYTIWLPINFKLSEKILKIGLHQIGQSFQNIAKISQTGLNFNCVYLLINESKLKSDWIFIELKDYIFWIRHTRFPLSPLPLKLRSKLANF